MAINPVQPNIDNKVPVNYREQKAPMNTSDNIKPLKPEGHLVHDNLMSIPKFWVKDIAYDMKAVKDGFQGNANDHQLGRLNDVGLKLGGIGIAAYLASRTSDPKLRLMEYLGLGSFLAAMSLYPKIAINMPSRLVHGFDIGKEYIDDQGRKKSVFQDSNYIPFDMYQGDYAGEDLDIIGDRLGIPRDIKNRHDLIKEQMRKIATQNNTLWMLTAGFATPVMAALTCVGLEQLIVPAMEAVKNYNVNSRIIKNALTESSEMNLNPGEIESNKLSKQVENILRKYEGKKLPKEEYDRLISTITEQTETNVATGIEEDLAKLLKSDAKYSVDAEEIISVIKGQISSSNNKEKLEAIFIPTEAEIDAIVKKVNPGSETLTQEQIRTLKREFKNLFESKMEPNGNRLFYKSLGKDIADKISESIKLKPIHIINDEQISQAVDFAKIIGDFKIREKMVDKAASIKFEEAPQTMLARAYEKFENTLFNVLEISFKDVKEMKESPTIAKEILEARIEALVKDEAKYAKAIEKLSKVMSDMEVSLHGKYEEKSNILDLIKAIENVYNNTAKRLYNLDKDTFSRTIDRLIKEDASGELNSIVSSREELFKLLDGTNAPIPNLNEYSLDYATAYSRGVGSAKKNAISRMIDRYQGVKNSFNRILLSLDVYKRGLPEDAYEKEVVKMGREYLLRGTSAQFTQKFFTVNNPELYRDIMYRTYGDNQLTQATKDSFHKTDIKTGNVFERFEAYIKRIREVMGNNDIDYTKPHHNLGKDVNHMYSQDALTRLAKFNLVAQDPVTLTMKAAERKYGGMVWLRKASIIGATILGTAVLAQFAFGKIKNPHNIQKQVNDDTNS